MASMPIFNNGGSKPHMNSAGTVKMIPDAMDDAADPPVCEMLHSRMLVGRVNVPISLNSATLITASGIDVLIVKPTLRPR